MGNLFFNAIEIDDDAQVYCDGTPPECSQGNEDHCINLFGNKGCCYFTRINGVESYDCGRKDYEENFKALMPIISSNANNDDTIYCA